MESDEIIELHQFLSEATKSLADLRHQTNLFLKKTDSKENKHSKGLKIDRSHSTAAWAKSTSARSPKELHSENQTVLDTSKAERALRTRAPAFSLGVARASGASSRKVADQGSEGYNVNIEYKSTVKRPRCFKFAPPPSQTTRKEPPLLEAVEPGRASGQATAPSSSSSWKSTEAGSKSYSFPKASKRGEERHYFEPRVPLDTTKSEKWLFERSPIARITPPPPPPSISASSKDEHRNNRTNSSNTAPSSSEVRDNVINALVDIISLIESSNDKPALHRLIGRHRSNPSKSIVQPLTAGTTSSSPCPLTSPKLSILSNHARTPSFSINIPTHASRKPTTENSKIMFEFEQVTAKTESTLDSFGSGAKCGKVYYEKVKPNPNKMQTVVEMNLRRQSNTPGPMHYDTAAAFAASHHRAPSPLVFRAQKEVVNACLLRKRYFEEKAEAAREEHDDQRDASDSLLRKRVPSVFISDAKPPINRNYSKQSFSSGDEKSSIRMSAVKEILQAEDLWDSDDDRFGAELGKVDESATAPAVYSVSYSQVETRPRDSVAMAKGVATKQAFEQMLVSKPGVAKAMAEKRYSETARWNRFLGPQLQVPWTQNETSDRVDVEEDPATRAYLSSSLAIPRTRTAVMRQEPSRSSAVNSAEADKSLLTDFIGPQLQVDWNAPASVTQRYNSVGAVLDMTKGRGRDEVRVHRKGEVETRPFNATTADLPKIGPSPYDLEEWYRLHDEAKGGAIPFAKQLSREVSEVDKEEGNMLDLDTVGAFSALKGDKMKRNTLLDFEKMSGRTTKDKEETSDHLGGSWFKGMADEINSKPAVVNFSKMSGRDVHDGNEEVNEFGVDGANLVLQTDGWAAQFRPKTDVLVAWKDPEQQPRFPAEAKIEERAVLSPHKVVLSTPMFVDMSKQSGRATIADELALVNDHVHGAHDVQSAVKLARDTEESLRKAKEGRSTKKGLDISKQIGRDDNETTRGLDDDIQAEYSITTALDAVRPSRGKVVADWSKQQGRSIDESRLGLENIKEELDLEPNEAAHSKFKRAVPANDWSLRTANRHNDIKPPESAALVYDYDPDILKRSNKGKSGSRMASEPGRSTREDDLRLLEGYLDAPPELVVNPSDHAVLKKTSGAGASWSKAKRPTTKTDEVSKKSSMSKNGVKQSRSRKEVGTTDITSDITNKMSSALVFDSDAEPFRPVEVQLNHQKSNGGKSVSFSDVNPPINSPMSPPPTLLVPSLQAPAPSTPKATYLLETV